MEQIPRLADGVGDRSMGISRNYSMATRSMTSKQIKNGGDRLIQSVADKYKLNQMLLHWPLAMSCHSI